MPGSTRGMSTHRQSHHVPRAPGSLVPLLTVLAAAAAIVAVVLLVIGEPGFAGAIAVLLLILVGAGAFDALVARRKLARHHGDVGALDTDERDTFPTMAADADVPRGATRESHTDLNPHDLPPDHPSGERVEEEASARKRRP